MATLKQDNRLAELTASPFGRDVLALTRLDVHEALCEPFEIRLEALSDERDLDFDRALGDAFCVKVRTLNGERHFHGLLTEAVELGPRDDHTLYRLVLRPWFWLLGHTANSRLFKEKSAPDIIAEVFQQAGFSDFDLHLTENYKPLEYCVQYRESDFHFVCRLMEHNGIFYYFRHEAGAHRLVLADAKASLSPAANLASVPFIALAGNDRHPEEHLSQWSSERRFQSGRVTLNEHDYLQPTTALSASRAAGASYRHGDLEVYDYPGKYYDRPGRTTADPDGGHFARVRLEARQAGDHRRQASGSAASLYPGGLTTLARHPLAGENRQYLVVRAAHSVVSDNYRSGSQAAREETVRSHLELQVAETPYRPPLLTRQPLIAGPQTAVVVGEKGEEIDVDEHGRILVRFHWDRDNKSSRRVRVAEGLSGAGWGSQIIPRVGQEVVVEFIEGDPDRPLVTGTVYNAEKKHPFALPAEKTKSGWKTDSTKGGGGFHELSFEDKKGAERLHVRAEKDMTSLVRHSAAHSIGETFESARGRPSLTTTVEKGDEQRTLKTGNQHVSIGHDQVVDVANEITITAGRKITLKVGGSKIEIESSSIKLTSTNITLKAGAALSGQGVTTDLKGSATVTIKGGVVRIN